MSVKDVISISQERAEDYMPCIFRDAKDKIAQRTYTHSNCLKTASYEAFKKLKDENGFRCPMCSSRENRVTPNAILDQAISSFNQNFKSRDYKDAKSSYNLACHFFKEEKFESVHKICKRALGFTSIDPLDHKNLRLLFDKAADEILESQLGISLNLQNIKYNLNMIKDCKEKLTLTQDLDQVKQLRRCIAIDFTIIAYEKNNIGRKYLQNEMQGKALEIFKEAILLLEKIQNVKDLDLSTKRDLIVDVKSSLESLGALLVSLNRFLDAEVNYIKLIKCLKTAISFCENKSDFTLEHALDNSFFKLSRVYLYLADKYFVQEGDCLTSKNYLEKAQKTLENTKEKNDEVKKLSELLSERLISIELNLKMTKT